MSTGKVLVLGDDTRSFLTVIRSLGRKGIEVHIGWYVPEAPELRSRYISAVHEIPPYKSDKHGDASFEWLGTLIELLQHEQFDLVIPTSDRTILPLHKHLKELKPFGHFAILEGKAFEVGFNKEKANSLARSLGIPLPAEKVVDTIDNGLRLAEKWGYPIVLKPLSSFQIHSLHRKQFVRKAYRETDLRNYLEEMLSHGSVTVQENFLGVGMGVELLARDGNVLAAFMHRRVHEPLMGGGSSYRMSVPLHRGMFQASRKMMAAMKYTGVAMIEFKWNPDTESWVFIEINARFWGSLPLAVAAGVDFPWYLYKMMVHGETSFPGKYRFPIYCRNLVNDLRWQWQNLKADKNDPTLATLPVSTVLAEWRHIIAGREYLDTFAWDDPMPAFAEIGEFATFATEGLRLLQRKFLSAHPVREAFNRLIRIQFRNAEHVLFVCKGNICRSPFAEHYARSRLTSQKTYSSAGYFPHDNRPSPPAAIEAAQTWNIDLSPHRSQRLDSRMVKQADLIFVFDEENLSTVLQLSPSAILKTWRLGQLKNREPLEIPDPFGGNAEDFRKNYHHITRCLDSLKQVSVFFPG